jgi:hypothetical protein
MPRRWRRPPAAYIGPGEWIRWQINYRFVGSCGGEWTYRLDTLNVANGVIFPNQFLATPPRHINELASLR